MRVGRERGSAGFRVDLGRQPLRCQSLRLALGSRLARNGLQGDGPGFGREERGYVYALAEVQALIVRHCGVHGCGAGQGCGNHVRDGAALELDAARQINILWEGDLEVEAVGAFGQATLTAQDLLVLEQGGKAIAKVFTRLLSLGLADTTAIAARSLGGRAWGLVNLHKAMQAHGDVGEADGLDDFDDDGARDRLAGAVLLVRVMGADGEFGDAASLLAKGGGKPVQDAASGRRRGKDGGRAIGARGHARSGCAVCIDVEGRAATTSSCSAAGRGCRLVRGRGRGRGQTCLGAVTRRKASEESGDGRTAEERGGEGKGGGAETDDRVRAASEVCTGGRGCQCT